MQNFLFTSESVTESHPDKLCDQMSDAVLDAILMDGPNARGPTRYRRRQVCCWSWVKFLLRYVVIAFVFWCRCY